MKEQLEAIKPEEFGIEPVQAKKIEEAFTPKISEREGLAKIYADLIKKDIDLDVCLAASDLRKKLVKIRTGIAAIHKSQKAFSLAYGKLVDAWKNKETEPVTQMEAKLLEIEKYYENQETERLEKLQEERMKLLTPFVTDEYNVDLTHYSQEEFQDLLFIKEKQYKDKIAEEARLKEEKEEQERKENNYRLRREEILKLGEYGIDVIDNLTIESTEEEYTSLLSTAQNAKLEKERIDKIYFDRLEEMAPYKEFFANIADYNSCEFGTMPDAEYNKLKAKVLMAKTHYDNEQSKIRKENERIKAEQEKSEREAKEAKQLRTKEALKFLIDLGYTECEHGVEFKSLGAFIGSEHYTNFDTDNELELFKNTEKQQLSSLLKEAKRKEESKEKERIDKIRHDREDEVKFLWQFVPKDHKPLIEYDDLEWEQFMVTVNSAKKKHDDEKIQIKIKEEQKRKQLEKELAEKKKKEEEEKKEKEKEEKAKAEEERAAKLAPEKDKIQAWIDSIQLPELDTSDFSEEGKAVVSVINQKYAGFRTWAEKQKESIN